MPVSTGGCAATGAAARRGSRAEVAPDERGRGGTIGFCERRRDDAGDARAERRHVALAVGVDAVRQEDDEGAVARIDPDRRAGQAGVAERADREAARRGSARSASRCPSRGRGPGSMVGRRRRRGHLRDRERREHAASSRASRRRAACGRSVARSAAVLKSPGVAGDAAHAPRGRIVHRRRAASPRPACRRASRAACTLRSARSAAASAAGGRNIVSFMPSGSKIARARERGRAAAR